MQSSLGTRIRKLAVQAISDFEMIEAEDHILVAVSGGKDSSILLATLLDIQRRAPIPFTLVPVILDQKQPGFSLRQYQAWVESLGVKLRVIEEDTFSIVKDKTAPGKSYCGLCSRLRRGILYNYAHEHGFSKIALGHHRDDANETVLMNMFYSGSLASMPPKLLSDDGRNTVIRPLVYTPEANLRGYAMELSIPTIPCNLCGSQDGLRRQRIKKLLRELEREDQQVGAKILAAQGNIKPTQLMDQRFWHHLPKRRSLQRSNSTCSDNQ